MNKNRVLVVCAMGLLSGCVPLTYVKQGGTSAEFEQVKQQCIYEAQLHVNNDPIMWPMIVQQCLRVKGWVGVK